MPLVETPPPGVGDVRELTATGPYGVPPPAMSADPQQEGTGANGPRYGALDAWAAAARTSVWGRAESNLAEARAAGVPWPAAFGMPVSGAPGPVKIPDEMAEYKSRFAGLYTQPEVDYRTGQIRQELQDQRAMAEHPWAALPAMAFGLTDPVGLASMAVPIAGATRVANAVRLGLVGAGVSVADEAIMQAMDPLHDFSLKNIGAGTILSGLLGAAIRPRVPADQLARLKELLQRELDRPIPEAPTAAAPVALPADDAASLGRDL
ncbi:MAG TPA: hypothetical protein VH137_01955, partial [Gemmatimonadales bacterium]|nr:hypothetical protein [Gemmatimonadales bacterium]